MYDDINGEELASFPVRVSGLNPPEMSPSIGLYSKSSRRPAPEVELTDWRYKFKSSGSMLCSIL